MSPTESSVATAAEGSLFSMHLISVKDQVFFSFYLSAFFMQKMLLFRKASIRKLNDKHHLPLFPNAAIYFHFLIFSLSLSLTLSVYIYTSVSYPTGNSHLWLQAAVPGQAQSLISHLYCFISTHTTFK